MVARWILLLAFWGVVPGLTARAQSDFCESLKTIKPGEAISLRIDAVFARYPERTVLVAVGCDGDLQTASWVEVEPSAPGTSDLVAALRETDHASVTIEGTLFGPANVPENKMVPPQISRKSQLSGRRYGHSNEFRTKFVITSVLRASPLARPVDVSFRRSAPTAPRILAMSLPSYPADARELQIQGTASVVVDVKQGNVAGVEGHGDVSLLNAAKENMRTWRFPETYTGEVAAVFQFVLIEAETSVDKVSVEMGTPVRVSITANVERWQTRRRRLAPTSCG